jgi:hypothetical protein
MRSVHKENVYRSKIFIFLAFLYIITLLSSCGDSKAEKQPEPSVLIETEREHSLAKETSTTADFIFPEEAEITFQPVDMIKLNKREINGTWEYLRTIPFGTVDGDPVSLEVFKDKDPTALCDSGYETVVLLRQKQETYGFNDCFSDSLAVNEHPEQISGLFVLEYRYQWENMSFIVQGAAELTANGPGRMGYFAYDVVRNIWYSFEDWGYPQLVDLDGNGTIELVNQFPGLHMAWPDVNVYKWNKDVLERGKSVKEVLQVPNVSASSAEIINTNHLNITAVTGHDVEHSISAKYRYEEGKLILIAE